MKKRGLAALAIGMSIMALGACSSSAEQAETAAGESAAVETTAAQAEGEEVETAQESGEKVEISFLHKWPEESRAAFWKSVEADFEASHPNIDVQIEGIADDPIKEKLNVMLGGGDCPDIFFSWGGEYKNKFIREGIALDLTEYYDADPEWRDSYIESLRKAGQFEGKQYGTPFLVTAKVFVYNKEIFEQCGVEVPQTYEEFLQVCQTIKDQGVTPIIFGNQAPWAAAHYITTFNQKCVPADVLEKDYNPASGEFTDPGYVEALKMLQELNDNGYFNDGVNSTSSSAAREMFWAGQGAIIYDEIANFQGMYEANMPGNWGWFACPPVEGAAGNQNTITGGADMFLVSASTEHPEESVEFLKYLTSMEVQEKMCKELGFQSCIKGAVNEETSIPECVDAMEFIETTDGIADWLDTAMSANVVDVYLANLQELLTGKSAEDVMADVQAEAARVAGES